MLPDSLLEWEGVFAKYRPRFDHVLSGLELDRCRPVAGQATYDRRTKENFSLEWQSWQMPDGTWGMTPQLQLELFFLKPLRAIDAYALIREGGLLIDAGCGAGMPSIEYARLGLEVIALDLSRGLEHGEHRRRRETPELSRRLHFVQGDIMRPPLRETIADMVFSMGVLHHTPNTQDSFMSVARALKPDCVFCVWLYAYEPYVTAVVQTLRRVTTKIPPPAFALLATAGAPLFQSFCWAANKTGMRSYGALSRSAARLALMDIFGATYAHWHGFEEIDGWFRRLGFERTTEVSRSRRGFGVIGMRGNVG